MILQRDNLPLFSWQDDHPAGGLQPVGNPSAPPPQNPCSPPADSPPAELESVRLILSTCITRSKAKTAPAIAAAAGLWTECTPQDRGTKVRQLIRTWYELLAVDGHVLIATSAGFYYTADPEELAHYDQTMQSRIHETALTLRRTRLQARVAAGMQHLGRGRWTR